MGTRGCLLRLSVRRVPARHFLVGAQASARPAYARVTFEAATLAERNLAYRHAVRKFW